LQPFIKRFLVVEFPGGLRDSHLPDAGLVGVFPFKGECLVNGAMRTSRAAITGLWDTLRTHEHSRGNGIVLTLFTAAGAAAFVRAPLDEFFNATVEMDGVLDEPAELSRLQEQLAAAANHARRIRIVEAFLLAHLRRSSRAGGGAPDPLVSAAVSLIENTRATMRVEELTRRVGLSQSALERRFRRIVGASPRQFASIVRLQHVARLRAAGNDFTSIAHAAGYCDQPHFNKDFKRFTGLAPEVFFGRGGIS
jgi:AraC-like DNA-binding protein